MEDGLRVPLGRQVVVPGRGRIFIRESGDPEAAVTVLLVHGWAASAGLNWAPAFEPLGRHFRVIAPDLRGHGRGLRSSKPFTLEDCADDLAALVKHLGCGPVIVVGYSMGGLVTQLVWRRHPEAVAGLVLCSTTRSFVSQPRQQFVFTTLLRGGGAAVRASRWFTKGYRTARSVRVGGRRRRRASSMKRWVASELRRHDMRQILEAGRATCQFDSSDWIGGVDVPVALVVTTGDRAVPRRDQLALASAIEGATVLNYDEDHIAFVQDEFAPVVERACLAVADRVRVALRAS